MRSRLWLLVLFSLLSTYAARSEIVALSPIRIETSDLGQSFNDIGAGITFDGRLVYRGFSLEEGSELWATDGTEDGTLLLADLEPEGSSSPDGFRIIGDTLYFYARDAAFESYIYRLDADSDEPFRLGFGLLDLDSQSILALDGVAHFAASSRFFRETNQFPFYEDLNLPGQRILDGCENRESLVLLITDEMGNLAVVEYDGQTYSRPAVLMREDDRGWRLLGSDGTHCYLEELRVPSGDRTIDRLVRFRSGELETLDIAFANFGFEWQQLGDHGYFAGLETDGTLAIYRVGPEDDRPSVILEGDVGRFAVVAGELYLSTVGSILVIDETGESVQLVSDPLFGINPEFVAYDGRTYITNSGKIYETDGTPEGTRLRFDNTTRQGRFRPLGAIEPGDARGRAGVYFTQTFNVAVFTAETGNLFRLARERTVDLTIAGSWVSEVLNDQGLLFQVGQRSNESRFLFVAWFLYFNGEPTWIVGNTDFRFGQTFIDVPMQRTSGLEALQPNETLTAERDLVGVLRVRFDGCSELNIDYDLLGLGAGRLPIRQLIQSAGPPRCVEW